MARWNLSRFIRSLFQSWAQLDWFLIGAVLILGIFSFLILFSLSLAFEKQIFAFILGFGLMVFLSFFNWEALPARTGTILGFYGLCLALLVLVLFWGQDIRGTRGWFILGDFHFQPVELAKLGLILVLAKYFSLRHTEMYQARHIFISFLYLLLPLSFVLLQPDLGSGLILIAIWVGMVVLSGIRLRQLMMVLLTFLVLAVLVWQFQLAPYQKERILSFLKQDFEPRGAGYSQRQSLIAIGSGGLLGQGLGKGLQAAYGFLPEVETDFIFSALMEALGLIGGIIILGLYSVVFWRLFRLGFSKGLDPSMPSVSNFGRLVAGGVGIWIFVQMSVNIGMTLGLIPVTGITLPFLSYGGSSLISLFLALGIYQGLYRHKRI